MLVSFVTGIQVGWGCEHPACAQLPTEIASGIRDVSAALLRYIYSLLLCLVLFVYTLTKSLFLSILILFFVAKGILLECLSS